MITFRNITETITLKSIQKVLLLVLLLSFFPSIQAQNGYGYDDPYDVNSTGITGYGRRGRLPLEDTSKLSKAAQDKIHEETVAKTIEKFKTNLRLDELQEIVISKVVTQCFSKQKSILSSDSSNEDKVTAMETLMKNTEREIVSFLNPNQKENFNQLVLERQKKFEKLKL